MPNSIFDIEFSPHKHLAHWDRIKALAEGRDASPVTMELDVSSKCNHSCAWCVDPPGSHDNLIMTTDVARKIMDEAWESGVKGVVFKGGGECSLHPDFDKLLRAARLIGFETGVVTNGSRLFQTNISQALADYSSYTRISIDGPTPESHREIHNSNDFNKIILGIEKLVSLRGNKRHPVIGATFCLDYGRRSLINECVRLGEKLDLDYILIRPPFCEEVGFPSPDSPEELEELRNRIKSAAIAHAGKTRVLVGNWIGDKELLEQNRPENQQQLLPRRDAIVRTRNYNGVEHITGKCPASSLFLVVTAEREVYGCCCLRSIKSFSFGKIDYEAGNSLKSILNGELRRTKLRKMRKTECLKHCTHPLAKINELIEYLSLPDKHHSSFI